MSSEEAITGEIDNFEETQDDEESIVRESMETQNEEVNTEVNEATEITDSNEENKTVKPKRVIRNPQPKLNEKTVMGLRGLGALESYFERVKFKGKGYEENDLNMLMKTYEYWSHRLFPKYPFDSCIARLETLGTKRAVITHIKKIRMGILNENEDELINTDEEQEIPSQNDGFVNESNEFDQLLSNDTLNETSLTEEQLEKIRQNKERAERIRKEKLQKIRQMSVNLLPDGTGLQQSKDMLAQSPCNDTDIPSKDLNEVFDVNNTGSNINITNDIELNQSIGSSQLLTGSSSCECGTQSTETLENNIINDDGNNEVDLDQILNIINVEDNKTITSE